MELELLNGIYKIPLKLMGMSNEMGSKKMAENNFISEDEAENPIN